MQLMHNGEGLYCLHTPFSEQAKRTLLNLPTQEKTSIKSENIKKAPSSSAPRPPEVDGPKWPPVTGL